MIHRPVVGRIPRPAESAFTSRKESTLMTLSTVLGMDVSKEWIDACLLPAGQEWHVSTQPEELQAWVQALPPDIELAVLEATGGLQAVVAALLDSRGIPVAVVNPKQIRDFARALGVLAKNDRVDARVIARFGQHMQPPARPLPTPEMTALRELIVRRQQIVDLLTAEKNRGLIVCTPAVQKNIHQHIHYLEKQLDALHRQIEEAVQKSPLWRAQEQLLTSMKGVGRVTAVKLMAHLPELGSLTRREIAALAGVAPYCHESGKRRGRSYIEKGRGAVRSALYMAALSALRYNPAIKQFAERLKQKGKKGKVILVACMRKMLVTLNAMMRDQIPWQNHLVALEN